MINLLVATVFWGSHPIPQDQIQHHCEVLVTPEGLLFRFRMEAAPETLSYLLRQKSKRDPRAIYRRFLAKYARRLTRSIVVQVDGSSVPLRIDQAYLIQRHHTYLEWRGTVRMPLHDVRRIEVHQNQVWPIRCSTQNAIRGRKGAIIKHASVGPNWSRRPAVDLLPFARVPIIRADVDWVRQATDE